MTTMQFALTIARGIWPLLIIGLIGTGLVVKDIVSYGYKAYVTRDERKPA